MNAKLGKKNEVKNFFLKRKWSSKITNTEGPQNLKL